MDLPFNNHRKVFLPDNKCFNFVFFFFEFILLVFTAYTEKPIYIFIALAGLIVVSWSFFSIKRTIYLLIAYSVLLPNKSAFLKYPYLKAPVSLELLTVILMLLLFYLLADMLLHNDFFSDKLSVLDYTFILFFIWIVLSAIWGRQYGGRVTYIVTELYFFSFYLCYFIISRSFKSIDDIRLVIKVIIIISVLVSFEYIYIAFRESGLTGGLLIKRVSTQQPHIAQITVPFLTSYYFFRRNKKRILLSSVLLIPLFLMVFFSQQRALWVGIFVSFIVLWYLSFIRQGVTLVNFFKFVLYLIMALAASLLSLLLIDKLFMGSSLLTLVTRLNTLLDLAHDASLAIRLGEISHTLFQWKRNIILGTGLGSWISPVVLYHIPENHVDNSYIFVLWKTGIVGLLLFISIYGIFLHRAFYLFRKTVNSEIQQIAAALIAGVTGLLIVAMTNTCIVYYRFIILWALVIGIIEVLYRKERSE